MFFGLFVLYSSLRVDERKIIRNSEPADLGFHSRVIWLPFVGKLAVLAYSYIFLLYSSLSERNPPVSCLEDIKALLLLLSKSVGEDE